ncbi:hypothetical protein GWO25_03580 [Candidatus Saccharibacteria bacterium]|nr:hypothetical protein [Candidatus Saccharibacteria bacterium]NIV72511.1 hypothetical protein [Calditrichia bacterium]
MDNFFKKHSKKLNSIALILMLAIPFLLYSAAMHGLIFQVKILLVLMIGTMLYVLIKG